MDTRKLITKLRFKCAKKLPAAARFALCVPIEIGEILTKIRILDKMLVLNQNIFEELTEDEIVRVVYQGLFYYILEHKKRSKPFAGNPKLRFIWNIASEIAISELLDEMIPTTKPLFLRANDIDAPPKRCVEYYYSVILDKMENTEDLEGGMSIETTSAETGSEDAGEHQEAGQAANYESQDYTESKSQDSDSAAEQDVEGNEQSSGTSPDEFIDMDSLSKEALKNMIRETIGRGIYSASEEIRYHAKNLDPRLDRNARKLISLLRSIAGKGPGVICKGRKPRRRIPTDAPDLVEYSRKGFGRTAVIIDVSGSVHSFLDDIYEAAAKAIKICANVDVYVGDTTILEKKKGVTSTKQVASLPIGLGTDMAKIIKEIDSYGYNNIVLISDGQTAWPENPTRATCIYVPVGPDANVVNVPNWIKIK